MRTSYEGSRGCGTRKGGGLYLMSDGVGIECGLLPVELHVCPTCGTGIKPARGWTWIEPDGLLPHHDEYTGEIDRERLENIAQPPPHEGCPLNVPGLLGERAGLLWIGEQFYKTPAAWLAEGREMGFSRRVKAVPKGFVLGETWVLAAHRKAIPASWEWESGGSEELKAQPGIFHIWMPERIEYVVKGTETPEEIAALEARGIEPVIVKPLTEQLVTA